MNKEIQNKTSNKVQERIQTVISELNKINSPVISLAITSLITDYEELSKENKELKAKLA